MSKFAYRLAVASGAVFLTVFGAATARPQDAKELSVSPTSLDRAAVEQATHLNHQARPARTPRGSAARPAELSTRNSASAAASANNSPDPALIRYPADVVYQGGAVVETAESHAVYMLPNGHCPVSQCWGDPEGFLRNLGGSEFVHVLDQYTGLTANDRYTVGRDAKVSYAPPSTPFTDNDILSIVHAVASATGQTGYRHIYHVFLPPGQDECFDSTFAVCYSPDNQQTFAFCAYHGSADFTDIGHILYSVEPYQNVVGCSDPPGTPNGQLVDSTNDTLSHETFETVSDPDGTGWWNSTPAVTGLFGEEIGDECVFITPPAFGDPSVFVIGHKLYAVQLEYSNAKHGCTNQP
jgi:hypothetical protein